MRSEKSIRNVAVGVVMQAVNLVTGFVMRTALIGTMGVTIAGLSNLFTEIIAILSMAELGVGSAITYSMYKPIAENDTDRLARLMTLYRDTYRIIAAVMMGVGLLLTPFVPYLVRDVDVPIRYVQTVYLLYVVQTASSYLLSYKAAIFEVSQNQYVATAIHAAVRVLICVACVLTLRLTRDFLAYLIVTILLTVLGNAIIALAATRRYPWMREHPKLPKEERTAIFANIKHMFVGKLSGKITNSTDNTLISVMVNTSQVGYYGNYSMLISSVRKIADQLGSAPVGSVGTVLVTESGEECSDIIRRMTFAFYFIASLAGSVLLSALTPVVRLWLGEAFTLPDAIVFVCVFNFFLMILRTPVWNMLTPSGLFRETKYVAILGTVINLIVSVALTLCWGMIGIFIGTTCTLVVQLTLNVWLMWRKRLNLSPWRIGWLLLAMTALGVGEMLAAWALCGLIATGSAWLDLALKLLTASALPLTVNLLVYRRTKEFQYLKWLTKRTLRRLRPGSRRAPGTNA